MKKIARNSLALGTATLIVTAGLSFSANGASTFRSYGEAQFIAASGAAGDPLVDPLGDALEANRQAGTSGAVACEPAKLPNCDDEAFTSSPAQALNALLGPIGNVLGAQVGPVGNHATARGGASSAASGAVTNNGIVNVGDATNPSTLGNATLDLTGAGSPLAGLGGIANLRLDTGAVAAKASLASPTANPVRDYDIAGGKITIALPALSALNTAVGGAVSTDLSDPIELNASAVCDLVSGLGQTLTGSLVPGVDIDLCAQLSDPLLNLDALLSAEISGLAPLVGGLENVVKDGVTFDFQSGEITIDLEAAFFAATGEHINEQAPNTEILAKVLPSLALNLNDIVADFKSEIVDQLGNLTLEVSLIGGLIPIPPLSLGTITDPLGATLLDPLFDALDDVLVTAGAPLANGLQTLVTSLNPLLKVVVNVPDAYRDLVKQQRGGVVTAAAGDIYSETALRVQVGPSGQVADLLLGNALVGPNAAVADPPTGAAAAAAGDDDGSDAPADNGDGSDANADSGSDAASDADANADTVADADAQADADVTTTLPSTGAPNLLPFWLLGIALLLFGGAVLVNERRRLSAS